MRLNNGVIWLTEKRGSLYLKVHPFRFQASGEPCLIPIIADEAVASGFGTGAVKVTPGHDQVDLEMSKRHPGFKVFSVINTEGKICFDPLDGSQPITETLNHAGSKFIVRTKLLIFKAEIENYWKKPKH